MSTVELIEGDCRDVLADMPAQSINCIVTSPPYFGLRDYGHGDQIGLEPTPAEFVEALVGVMREARRVLRDDGTRWLNLGDSYAGSWGAQGHRVTDGGMSGDQIRNHPKRASLTGKIMEAGVKPKDLYGIPWRVAFALQADGWYLRQDIIWHKPNPMPESVRDRCTKAHEYVFLLSKSERYHFDADAIAEPAIGADRVRADRFGGNKYTEGVKHSDGSTFTGSATRNKRDVWTIPTKGFKGAHFATFPEALVEPCILAGCPEGGTVLDPFGGSGTVGVVARRHGRNATLIELNPEYYDIASERLWPAAVKEAAE